MKIHYVVCVKRHKHKTVLAADKCCAAIQIWYKENR